MSTWPITPSTTPLLFMLANVADEVTTVESANWSSGAENSSASLSLSCLLLEEINSNSPVSTEKLIEEAIYRVVIVVVCVIGLVCNIINLIVLSRKSLTATMERLERSAHYGLVGKRFRDKCSTSPQLLHGHSGWLLCLSAFSLNYFSLILGFD